eukprot:11226767-Lingulodinium_polyedra.AAC.1
MDACPIHQSGANVQDAARVARREGPDARQTGDQDRGARVLQGTPGERSRCVGRRRPSWGWPP